MLTRLKTWKLWKRKTKEVETVPYLAFITAHNVDGEKIDMNIGLSIKRDGTFTYGELVKGFESRIAIDFPYIKLKPNSIMIVNLMRLTLKP